MATAVPPELEYLLKRSGRIALALSGGADSAYLMYAAVSCGTYIKSYIVSSQFQKPEDTERAFGYVSGMGCPAEVLRLNILSDIVISSNPPNRCYLCKRKMFAAIRNAAERDGRALLMDATNASDDPAERPGMKALKEMGVVSPLSECGIPKSDIRRLSKEAGLPTWNMPSDSCLATRIPYGTRITSDDLTRTSDAEAELSRLGLSDFRVRTIGNTARLETVAEQDGCVADIRDGIERILLKYYDNVTYGRRDAGH